MYTIDTKSDDKYFIVINPEGFKIRISKASNTNICSNDKRDLCLFIKDNLIYVASGRTFYKNNTTQYFNYVGKILNKGEALQLSIFDI